MKTRWMVTILLIASLVLVNGCKKKETPKTPAEPSSSESTGMMDTMKQAASDTAKSATEAVKQKLSMDVDLSQTVSDLKAQAADMDVENLMKVATKYKDAIMEKQAQLKPLMDKLAAIPAAEKIGDEAKGLTTEIKTLTDAIAALKERFGVYVDAIKAKGGDISKLSL